MRVCHVIEAGGGGAGRVVVDLAQEGVRAGDAVTVVCGTQRVESSFTQALARLPQVRLVFSPMRREIGLRDIGDAFQLWRVLRKLGPFDVLHGHCSKAGALTRMVGAFFSKSAKIYTPHGLITLSPKASRLYGWIERALAPFCHAIVAVSQGEARHALTLGLPASKIKVIPNGTTLGKTLSRQEARQRLGLSPDEQVFGFVGRMHDPKNPVFALEAFSCFKQAYPDWSFCLIGQGPLLSEAQAAIDRLGLGDRAHLLGFCDGRQAMAAFDALVCSSDYETLPITFLEALACGVPIVTRRVCGVEEAILEGQTGFAAQVDTTQGLAKAMQAFAATTLDERQGMRDHAIAHAKNFTRERMGQAARELYLKFAAGS